MRKFTVSAAFVCLLFAFTVKYIENGEKQTLTFSV